MSAAAQVNSPSTVLFASLIGATIELFDFYIYATAAVLVFPKLFFPGSDPSSAMLQSFATCAIAFFAPYVATALADSYGIASVGWRLSATAAAAAIAFRVIAGRSAVERTVAGRTAA